MDAVPVTQPNVKSLKEKKLQKDMSQQNKKRDAMLKITRKHHDNVSCCIQQRHKY